MILSKVVKPSYIFCDKQICNASLLHHKGATYLIGRVSNYSCGKYINNSVKYYVDGNIFTDELLYKFDLKNKTTQFIQYITKTGQNDKLKYKSVGFEDFRVITWNNKKYIFTVLDKNHQCQVFKFELTPDLKLNLNTKDTFKTNNIIEKNWQPIEILPDKCIYSYKPFQILDFKTKILTVQEQNISENFSGSSQVIKIDKNRNLALVHTRQLRTYKHYFIEFNDNMKITKVSKPFSFIGLDVEFNCFMEKNGNILRILVGINDSNTLFFEVPLNIVDKIITNQINTTDEIDYSVLNQMINKNANVLSKLCLITYSNDKNILQQALKIIDTSKLNQTNKKDLKQIILFNLKGKK